MIKTVVLPSKKMRRLGFTQRVEGTWYICKPVLPGSTTFNLNIDAETGAYETTVICEYTGQPEYYGNMISPYRELAKAQIDVVVYELNRAGLNVEHSHKPYGFGTAEGDF